MLKRITLSVFIVILLNVFFLTSTYAENDDFENRQLELNDENTIYWEDTVNTGNDNGFSEKKEIKKDDPHYGWKLGKFALSGFSSKRKDDNGNWIFLKNVGDEITLYFNLKQDISKLDNNEKLKIESDKNGYDNEFGIKQTEFGKGCLIVRKIDSTGNKNDPEIYTDYLSGVSVNANTKINVYEEGDYEVALDYEILEDNGFLFKKYNNYRIRFNFSIRNGNCIVFPFDVKTRQELNNTSITENGFYLDLANSQYLDVNIKKEILKDGADGLSEDTRYNRPAKSGEEFTEEGIYTITVRNNYTNETTIKKIYVGMDKILKAHVQTGKSIDNIKTLVNVGATIDKDGNINNIPKEYRNSTLYDKTENDSLMSGSQTPIILIVSILFVLIIFIVILYFKNRQVKIYKEEIYKYRVNNPDSEENNNEVEDENAKRGNNENK